MSKSSRTLIWAALSSSTALCWPVTCKAQENLNQQIAVMSPILVGLDGVRRMGKSLGNYIGISESPYDMMKKFMQLPDGVMKMYFELLTEVPLEEVDRLLAGHLKEAKVTLAEAVIGQYHSAADGDAAAADGRQKLVATLCRRIFLHYLAAANI